MLNGFVCFLGSFAEKNTGVGVRGVGRHVKSIRSRTDVLNLGNSQDDFRDLGESSGPSGSKRNVGESSESTSMQSSGWLPSPLRQNSSSAPSSSTPVRTLGENDVGGYRFESATLRRINETMTQDSVVRSKASDEAQGM
jgi:hypothetical protein